MLVFASSDKGGTGRSVTSCNLAFQLSLLGKDVAYLDFDFGSPTAGAIFEADSVQRGTAEGGLHSYIDRRANILRPVDVREYTTRRALQTRQSGSGRLVLYPGDEGGAEFPMDIKHVDRAATLLRGLDREFDVCVIDLSAGRSQAVEMTLRALATPALQKKSVIVRWLVFHRWTRQHVLAANGLIHQPRGILEIAQDAGHDRDGFQRRIRSVRTAVPDLNAENAAERPAQAKWLRTCHDELKALARENKLGQSVMLGETPLEPMLLWREQVIMDTDVNQSLANASTVAAFGALARSLSDANMWEGP